MARREPHEYHWVHAWGRYLGFTQDRILHQQELAASMGAPTDALYYSKDDSRWPTAGELPDAVWQRVERWLP